MDESSSEAKAIIREIESEQADRGTWDSLYTQVARRVLPRADTFQGRNTSKGERRSEWQFDSLAVVANERFSAAYNSMATPPNEYWHGLAAADEAIEKVPAVKRWCDAKRNMMFKQRYNHRSNFASQVQEIYENLGAFGTGILGVFDPPGKPVNYVSCPLSKTWIREGDNNRVNWVYRELNYKPHRAISEFGKNNLPQRILQAADKSPNQEFTFYHRVAPSEFVDAGKRDFSGMAYASHYVSKEGSMIVGRGGFRTFPFAIARHLTSSNETYGRSVAMTALPDIKMRNEMRRSILRSTHRMAEPILLLSDDASLSVFQMRPGYRNKGYLTDDGVELAKQLEWRGDLNPALVVMEETGKVINDIFFVTLFQILVESPQMTATEVLERMKEKGVLLTPTVGRFQTEFLGALIERELDIYAARGLLEDMPDELLDAGGYLDINYNSPLSRAQKAEGALGFVRTMEAMAPFAQTPEQQQDLIDRFDLDNLVPELSEIYGMPLHWLRDEDALAAQRAARQQQTSMQQSVLAAQPLASAAKDAAQARLFTQQAS